MAQSAGELRFSIDSEGFTTWVPPTFTSTHSVSLVTPGFHPQVSGAPQLAAGHWQTCAPPDPVTEPILMIARRAPEAPLTPSSQGYVTLDIPSTAVTFAISSRPLESAPRPILQLIIPTHGSPEVRWRLPRHYRACFYQFASLMFLLPLRFFCSLHLHTLHSHPYHRLSCSQL